MKLFGLAFLVGLLSVQGFPAGEIGVSHGISVDVFINTMLSSFSAVKGKDNCDGVVSVFQNILEAWKGKETFLTESFFAAFKTALAVKKAKETLIFHHAIDAFKTVLEVGKVKQVLISEGFLLAFKGALEAKKTVISEVFLKAFEAGFWPGGKFLGNPNNGSNSSISVDFFVKTMVSVFGAKDGVITESFIQTFTETFSKCKGGHADFISAWKKAFDTCRGKNKVVPIAAFILALKKESGWSFIPSDCLDAIKSPENAALFPVGIKEKILSALFNKGGTESDVSQNQPISPEGPKSSISVDFFVKTMVSVFGAKDGVITESFIQTFTETFSKCKGGHADFIFAWKKAFDSCRGKNKVVPIAAFTLALKKESGWSFIPSDCLDAIKSPENAALFPVGIKEKILSALFNTGGTQSDVSQNQPISPEGPKSSISVDFFVKTMVSVFGAKDGVITESFIQTFTETFSKCKGGHADFIFAWKKAFDSCRGKNKVVPIAAFTLALKKESGWSFIPSDCLDAIKSPENAALFPVGIKEKILSALFNTGGTQSDVSQNQPISPEGPKSSISVDFFVKTMVSVFGAKDGVITESFIQTFTETFSKCKGGHADFIFAWKKAFDSCRGKNKVVPIAAFILALKKESGWSFIPSDCLDAIKSPENADVFPVGIKEKILSALFNKGGTESDVSQNQLISPEGPKSSISVDFFVKTMVSVFGAKDGVITESFIQTFTETFSKCKGGHADFISAWKKAFNSCRGKNKVVPIAAFILALKKESGWSFIPSDCLKAIKSPENSFLFPNGIQEKLVFAFSEVDSIKSGNPQAPISGTPGDILTRSEELPSLLDPTPASSPSKSETPLEPSLESSDTTAAPENVDPIPADSDSTTTLPDNVQPIPASSDSTTTNSPITALFNNVEPMPASSDSATTNSPITALFDNVEPIPANSNSATPGSDATKSNTVPDTPTPESLGRLGDKSVTPSGPNSSGGFSGGLSKASSVAKSVASGNYGKTTAVSESVSKTSGENSATASAVASATAGSSSGATANAASTASTTADKNPTHSKPCNKKSPILTPAKVIDAKSSIVAAGAAEVAAIIPGLK